MAGTLQGKVVTIFGGTGFVGRYVVSLLAREGATVKVVSRVQNRAYFLRTAGVVGQIVPVGCDYKTESEIDAIVRGSDMVVNASGILNARGKNSFKRIHQDIPQWIAQACAKYNVERLVQVSSLAVSQGHSDYAHSKRAGEQAILAAYPAATILRPSVIFGPEDQFFNMFAGLSRIAPALPLIGGGKTKFQPVYVGDVAQACVQALILPASGENDPRGKVYELGGPEVLSFKQIFERLFSITGVKRPLVNLPYSMAKLQGRILGALPKPLLTLDQVKSLETDNVVAQGALGLRHLGVEQTSLDTILPTYLAQYRPGGRFGDKKRAS